MRGRWLKTSLGKPPVEGRLGAVALNDGTARGCPHALIARGHGLAARYQRQSAEGGYRPIGNEVVPREGSFPFVLDDERDFYLYLQEAAAWNWSTISAVPLSLKRGGQ